MLRQRVSCRFDALRNSSDGPSFWHFAGASSGAGSPQDQGQLAGTPPRRGGVPGGAARHKGQSAARANGHPFHKLHSGNVQGLLHRFFVNSATLQTNS